FHRSAFTVHCFSEISLPFFRLSCTDGVSMLKLAHLALAAALVLPTITFADDTSATKPSPPPPVLEGPGSRLQMMLQRDRLLLDNLKLTDDQKQKIDKIYADTATKIQDDLRNLDGPQRFGRIRQSINDAHLQLSAILTED